MKEITVKVIMFVLAMSGIVAMTAVASYYPDASGYINFGILVLTVAALVGYVMIQRGDLKSRG